MNSLSGVEIALAACKPALTPGNVGPFKQISEHKNTMSRVLVCLAVLETAHSWMIPVQR